MIDQKDLVKDQRSLVTFVLVAYNQEGFIREAIEGAFSQTYQPLEIILSDDCSCDRTFEIMAEMAANYRGPHKVRAVRNKSNLGILPHILTRGREAKGEIIVIAAGDDVSKSRRTQILVERFSRDPNVYCVTSAFDLIDEHSNVVAQSEMVPIGVKGQKTIRTFLRDLCYPYTVIQGSTASYRRHLLEQMVPVSDLTFPEDNFFNFLIYLLGGYVVQVAEPLVGYRQHPGALSNRDNAKLRVEELEASFQSEALKRVNLMKAFLRLARREDRSCEVDVTSVLAELERSSFVYEWPHLSVAHRISSTLMSVAKLRLGDAKWKALRLAGRFPSYQPKRMLCRFHPKYAGKPRSAPLVQP